VFFLVNPNKNLLYNKHNTGDTHEIFAILVYAGTFNAISHFGVRWAIRV